MAKQAGVGTSERAKQQEILLVCGRVAAVCHVTGLNYTLGSHLVGFKLIRVTLKLYCTM